MADRLRLPTLRAVNYRVFYRPSDNPLETFYLPTLAASVHYDRSAGYFRSSALAAAAAGIVRLIENNGRMRLLVGAELSREDVEAIQKGYDLRRTLERGMLAAFPDPADPALQRRLEALAWMVASGTLDIKVVLPLDTNGLPIPGPVAQDYYHAKKGIFTDAEGNQVGFIGSVNESAQGWQGNFEEFSVSLSWEGERDRQVLGYLRASFNDLWDGRDAGWLAVELPEAVRQRLLKFAPERRPDIDPLERPAREVVIADGREGFAAVTAKDRLLFQFLRDAPYLTDAVDLGAATSGVIPWPHQLHVARSVIERYPESVMLADEVGLGKTIEAGLVIRQLVLSGRVKRCLILAPASVTRQWQEELYEKFNLDAPRFDRGEIFNARGEVVAVSDRPWDSYHLLLASSHLARRRERVRELVEASPWDLLVVDEAHHARRRDFLQPQYRPNRMLTLLNTLRAGGQFRALLLMTATPMQVHPVEVWDLLALLGLGGRWGADEHNFLEFFTQLRQPYAEVNWNFVYDMVADHLAAGGRIDPDFEAEMQHSLGKVSAGAIRALPERGQGRPAIIRSLPAAARPFVAQMARRHTPINHFVFRNTRRLLREYVKQGLLKDKVPTRRPHIQRIPFRPEESELYRRITEYITYFYQKYEAERRGLGFIMTVYRRRLTSSFYAIRRSLEKRRDWLQGVLVSSDEMLAAEDLWEDEDLQEELEQAGLELPEVEQLTDEQKANFQKELDYLDAFIADLRDLSQADSKLTFLKVQLDELFRQRDTVLVFTQYADTMDYLRDHLCTVYGGSVACYSGRGGEQWNGIAWVRTTKEVVKNAFRDGRVKILLCTESASEGLNLQTCGMLINYDMPWNPMRVEQRIGRIDRIGQTFDEVWVHNYFYQDTIEDRIYQALKDRINWFEAVVGELQPILAAVGEVTRRLAMLPAEAQARAFEQQMRDLEAKIEAARTQAFSLDDNLKPEKPALTSRTPVTLADLQSLLTGSPATGRLFRPHPDIAGAYVLTWQEAPYAVTFSRELFDLYPDTLQLLSYGNSLLEALLQAVPEPDGYPPGIIRLAADDPFDICGWYSADHNGAAPITRLSSLRQVLERVDVTTAGDAAVQAAQAAFQQEVERLRQSHLARLEQRSQRRRQTLRAKARRLLLQAAMVEVALGQQRGLFTREPYPTTFSEAAVTGLARHGKTWRWMLQIGHEMGLRPDSADPFNTKLANLPPDRLHALFGSLTHEATALIKEWLRAEGQDQG